MTRFAEHRHVAAECRFGIDKFGGAKRRAALLALVAISFFVVAARAGAGDVTVGQKLMVFFVVVLLGNFLGKAALVVEFFEKSGCCFVMDRGGSARIDVERNTKFGKRIPNHRVVFVHDVLRANSQLPRFDGDGHAVFVAAADKKHLLAFAAQVAHVCVGRNINARHVADVQWPVGIGQRRCYRCSFKILSFVSMHCPDYFYKKRGAKIAF